MTRTTPSSDLARLSRRIAADFAGACRSLYWINPRAGASTESEATALDLDVDEPDAPGLEPLASAPHDGPPGTEGLARLRLWPEQVRSYRILRAQHRAGQPGRLVKVKPRQSGDSTFAEAWNFHHTYWQPHQRALTVAHHDKTTNALYAMTKTFYNELPPELQWPEEKNNRKELSWRSPSGSSIIAQTAGFLDIGHGLTLSHAHLSEIDLWVDPETALEGIMETTPDVPGTTIIIESKAQGHRWLYQFWKESKAGTTGFYPQFTAWFQVPEFRRPVPRDFERTPEEDAWVAEFTLTDEQVYWYRRKRDLMVAKEPAGGLRRMKSSYPFTDEEAFQASGYCVFPDVVLTSQRAFTEAIAGSETFRLLGQPNGAVVEVPVPVEEADLVVYEPPMPGAVYSLGLDIGEGVGKTESVASVCRYPGYVQVAEWANDRVGVDQVAFTAAHLAQRYGGSTCVIIPEINKSGILVAYILNQLAGDYSVFLHRYLDRPGGKLTDKVGWETTHQTKGFLVQVANMIFLRGLQRQAAGGEPEGVLRSPVLVQQMTTCLDVMAGRRWVAEGRSDRIIAWLIAMMGAYLEYEGGSVGGIGSARAARPGEGATGSAEPIRWPNSFDMAEEVFDDQGRTGWGVPHLAEDLTD